MRLSLFVFDNDGDYDTGAEIRKYMGAPLAEIKDAITGGLSTLWALGHKWKVTIRKGKTIITVEPKD